MQSVENVQDGFNIEQFEEPVSSSECSLAKAVNVAGESSSSARPSDLAVAT